MTTAIHRFVEQARMGTLPRAVVRLSSGWVVLAESQRLPGYCILLPDPVVPDLNDLAGASRERFLADMALVGDAVIRACRPRRLNYAMLGNQEPALHAHVIPRYEWEQAELRSKPIWSYPPEEWGAAEHTFDPHKHRDLIERIGSALRAMV